MKNNIRYKGNTNNTSAVIFFNWRTKTPSDVTLLGRTSSEVFVMLVVVVHSFLFFILLLFFVYFQATLLCHRHFTLASQAREGLHQLWALPRLLLIAFSFSSTASATVLSGHFLPTGVFYLTLLPDIFGIPNILAQPAFIKVSLGAGSYFLESCRASYWSSKHRPGPSVCLIHSNPQSSYSERFSFKFYHILSWIACGESLIYLLLTRFELFSLVQSHM